MFLFDSARAVVLRRLFFASGVGSFCGGFLMLFRVRRFRVICL